MVVVDWRIDLDIVSSVISLWYGKVHQSATNARRNYRTFAVLRLKTQMKEARRRYETNVVSSLCNLRLADSGCCSLPDFKREVNVTLSFCGRKITERG